MTLFVNKFGRQIKYDFPLFFLSSHINKKVKRLLKLSSSRNRKKLFYGHENFLRSLLPSSRAFKFIDSLASGRREEKQQKQIAFHVQEIQKVNLFLILYFPQFWKCIVCHSRCALNISPLNGFCVKKRGKVFIFEEFSVRLDIHFDILFWFHSLKKCFNCKQWRMILMTFAARKTKAR